MLLKIERKQLLRKIKMKMKKYFKIASNNKNKLRIQNEQSLVKQKKNHIYLKFHYDIFEKY